MLSLMAGKGCRWGCSLQPLCVLALSLLLLLPAVQLRARAQGSGYTEAEVLLTPDEEHQNAEYGACVAAFGDLLVVGAPQYDRLVDASYTDNYGAVFVYRFDPYLGEYRYLTMLLPDIPSSEIGVTFGTSVATDGLRIVVGAMSASPDPALYVWVPSPDTVDQWEYEATLRPQSAQQAMGFGASVAIGGDTIVGGAPESNSVTLFQLNSGIWTDGLTFAETLGTDSFGDSVAISADAQVIVVGAPSTASSSGAVGVIRRSVAGGWGTSSLVVETGMSIYANSEFGYSVALHGNVLVVGAPGSESGKGQAFVYRVLNTSLSEVDSFTALDITAGDRFGHSVAIHGDVIVVGSPDNNAGSSVDRGSIYVYQLNLPEAVMEAKIVLDPGNQQTNARFGQAVAVHGDRVYGGAPARDGARGAVFAMSRIGCGEDQEHDVSTLTCVPCAPGTKSLLGSPCSCPNGQYLGAGAVCTNCAKTDVSEPGTSVEGCICVGGSFNDGEAGCTLPDSSNRNAGDLLPILLVAGGIAASLALVGAVAYARSSSLSSSPSIVSATQQSSDGKASSAKESGAKASGAKASDAKANGVQAIGTKANGAKASGAKANGAKASGANARGVQASGAKAVESNAGTIASAPVLSSDRATAGTSAGRRQSRGGKGSRPRRASSTPGRGKGRKGKRDVYVKSMALSEG